MTAASRLREEELDAIVARGRAEGKVSVLVAERLIEEIRYLKREAIRTALLGIELTKEMRRLTQAAALAPPGAPKLADFDS